MDTPASRGEARWQLADVVKTVTVDYEFGLARNAT
jgi:hypothetical protein